MKAWPFFTCFAYAQLVRFYANQEISLQEISLQEISLQEISLQEILGLLIKTKPARAGFVLLLHLAA
jgi:hypothetical protein